MSNLIYYKIPEIMKYSDRWDYVLKVKRFSVSTFSSEVGITRATYYNWKNTGNFPDQASIKAIKEIIPDLNWNWLFFDEGAPFLEKIDRNPVLLEEDQEKVTENEVHETVTTVRVPKTEWDLELISRIERLEAIVINKEAELAIPGKIKVYLRPKLYLNKHAA
ncbi:hypothetical protein [Flexithrix dorotheae]|uniref:hypothetical protein n=1 Tax=Flexithrix dorotheae TaxID=70993 RepID=UPI00037E8E25|nr:hypothetical protein [Flexithrix dorotheae]